MSTPLYSYSPSPRQLVSVEPAADGAAEAHIVTRQANGTRADIPVPDVSVPEVARGLLRGLYEAAGLPVPIVLDRVDGDRWAEWISAFGHDAGRVLIDPKTPLTFEAAREFAAALVGAVERAESEPDPAEVEALAVLMRQNYPGMAVPSDGDYGLAVCREMAKTILARYDITERKPGGRSDG